jgi:hypothetical protein
MDLKAFLSSRYESKNFEHFISERFYGFEVTESDFSDDDLSESEKKHIEVHRFLGQAELDDGKELGFFEFISNCHIQKNSKAKIGKFEILG